MPRFAWALVVLLAVPLVLLGWAGVVEPRLLLVNEVEVTTAKWPADEAPLRIAVVGDLHVGSPGNGLDNLARVVASVNAERPDLVLLVGDYVIHAVLGGRFVPPEAQVADLSQLAAPLGVYAVLGNHDWWLDGPRVRRALEAAGIVVLENEAVPVPADAPRFWLAGMADDMTRTPLAEATVAQAPPDMPVIAMAHDPVTFLDMPGRVALTLAGHTHGGQLFVPFYGAPIIPGRGPRRFAYGHIREDGNDLYVTAGIGTSILPIRLNMPPEIAVITLRAP